MGVEISPEQVAIARREIPGAVFEVGDISTHSLPANVFGLATMVMVGEFLDAQTYPQALSNIFAAMSPGGIFINITTHPDRYKAKYGVTHGEVITKGPWGGGDFTNYVRGVNEQVRAVRSAGFSSRAVQNLDLPWEALRANPEFAYPHHHVRLAIVAQKPGR